MLTTILRNSRIAHQASCGSDGSREARDVSDATKHAIRNDAKTHDDDERRIAGRDAGFATSVAPTTAGQPTISSRAA